MQYYRCNNCNSGPCTATKSGGEEPTSFDCREESFRKYCWVLCETNDMGENKVTFTSKEMKLIDEAYKELQKSWPHLNLNATMTKQKILDIIIVS